MMQNSGTTTNLTVPDLEYAEVDGHRLYLDLFLPNRTEKPPLIVYIHGGSWRNLDRKTIFAMVPKLIEHGYAVASIDYRLSSNAKFPAQIHDAKGAIRWLRAHAGKYGFDPARIFVMGNSAGAYIALLVALTAHDPRFEGTTAGHIVHPSTVSGVVDFYAPTDFLLRAHDQPETTEIPDGKVYQLLGGAVSTNPDLARLASPVTHLSPEGPPILVFHGTADQTVLPNQSDWLVARCHAIGHPVEFHKIEGGAHGDPRPAPSNDTTRLFYNTPENLRTVLNFLRRNH